MFRYGLAIMLRGVNAYKHAKKSANGFENLLLQGLASHSENCCCFIISSTHRKVKLIISLNL